MKRIIIEWESTILPGQDKSTIRFEGSPSTWEVHGILRHYSRYLEVLEIINHNKQVIKMLGGQNISKTPKEKRSPKYHAKTKRQR